MVLDQSPFYAEMGGQAADHGTISADGILFTVSDVQKNKGGKFMHYGRLTQGTLHVGDTVHAAIDTERRKAIMRAHSATHLLDAALKKVLGDHVHQAGSLVEPDRLRFDFTHFEAITPEQLRSGGGAGQRRHPGGLSRGDGGAAHRGGQEEGRRGHVRREVRRHRPGGGDGRLSPWSSAAAPIWTTPPRPVPSASKSEDSVASGVRRIEATVRQADAWRPWSADQERAVPGRPVAEDQPLPSCWSAWSSRPAR